MFVDSRVQRKGTPADVNFTSTYFRPKKDDGNDEEDGYDETLIPLDYQSAGQIRDDDLLRTLVVPMGEGVFVTSIMDCCHSGTVLDLPYNFKADGEQSEMEEGDFKYDSAFEVLGALSAGNAATVS